MELLLESQPRPHHRWHLGRARYVNEIREEKKRKERKRKEKEKEKKKRVETDVNIQELKIIGKTTELEKEDKQYLFFSPHNSFPPNPSSNSPFPPLVIYFFTVKTSTFHTIQYADNYPVLRQTYGANNFSMFLTHYLTVGYNQGQIGYARAKKKKREKKREKEQNQRKRGKEGEKRILVSRTNLISSFSLSFVFSSPLQIQRKWSVRKVDIRKRIDHDASHTESRWGSGQFDLQQRRIH